MTTRFICIAFNYSLHNGPLLLSISVSMVFVLSIITIFFLCQGHLCVTLSLFCSGNFLLVIWEKKIHLVIPHGYRKMVCLTPVPPYVVVWCILFYYSNHCFLDRGRVVLSNVTIELMFLGINMFWAWLRLIKMSLRRAQNIFMPKNINSITINITLEGIEKIKTEKNDNNIFFTSAVRKRQQTLKWLLDFDWLLRSYDYLILIFYWFISAG